MIHDTPDLRINRARIALQALTYGQQMNLISEIFIDAHGPRGAAIALMSMAKDADDQTPTPERTNDAARATIGGRIGTA